jgi:hypothetical protein
MNSLWMYDFNLFYHAAQAVLQGLSPYTVWDFNGPYPLAVIFVPFTLLPMPLAYCIFITINLYLLFRVCRWKGLWALFSFPVLFGLFTGQIDLFLALLLSPGSPWLLPLAIVKPQLAWLIMPALAVKLDKKDYLKTIGVGAAFLAFCFFLRPTWVTEWQRVQPSIQFYSRHASSLYWLVPPTSMDLRVIITVIFSVIVFVAGFFFKERTDSWAFLQLFQPLTNIYSASALAEWIGPLEFALSWVVVFVVGGNIHDGMPLFVIPLGILFRLHLLSRIWPNSEREIAGLKSLMCGLRKK